MTDPLPHFQGPDAWDEIDAAVRQSGGAILEGLITGAEVEALNREIDDTLSSDPDRAAPATGSRAYDFFLGHKTLRLHGLCEKVPGAAELIGRTDLVSWAERVIGSQASSVLLNAGELIQIQPGEPAQFLHRDSDSWPIPIGPEPVVVNAIVALDACTLENGATYVAPGSWQWEPGRLPRPEEFARAVMKPGDAVLFRGDLIHGGGENESSARRRALSISYCAGWLRPVENSFLNLSLETVRTLPPRTAAVLGYAAHDATANRGGIIGLYENGDPVHALDSSEAGGAPRG